MIKNGSSSKPEFEKIGQIFVQLTERSASVPHILGIANDTWGPGHVLVTNDGLLILDSDGTRGEYVMYVTLNRL